MNKYFKKGLQYSGWVGLWTAEKGLSEIALPAAVLSATRDGSYLERAVAGVTTTLSVLKNAVEAYAMNEGVRDFVNSLAIESMKAIGRMGENLEQDPRKVLYAALLTYAGCKAIPALSKLVRKRVVPYFIERRLEKEIVAATAAKTP